MSVPIERLKTSTRGPIRVVVADDQALFRRGLSVVLAASEDIEVVGEASDGEEAVAKAQELTPDVVLMDVRMPRLSGIEAARHIRRILPATEILMLTVSDEEEDLYESVKAGANGYLLKEIAIEEIAETVRDRSAPGGHLAFHDIQADRRVQVIVAARGGA